MKLPGSRLLPSVTEMPANAKIRPSYACSFFRHGKLSIFGGSQNLWLHSGLCSRDRLKNEEKKTQ